ncbi:MAG: hypothetical protein QGH60_00375 [Phycisphaerae bacterium]|jgi:hypothetical protein|nr:hypothetical protein [Phycisphaerae bacterium]
MNQTTRLILAITAALSVVALCGEIAQAAEPLATTAVWDREYGELAGHIGRLKKWRGVPRDRLSKETLDQQALTLPEDKDPLDIVLRRTGALLQYYKKKKAISAAALAKFDKELSKLSARAKSAADAAARKALFVPVCKLRRELAFANPLLDFDRIVCMLEKPGRARIIEQARACWGGHSKGGGPIVISDFKSKPRIDKPLAGVGVTSGPWKGKTLEGYFSGLELSFDGKQLLFAATTSADVWHVFRFDIAKKQLVQLTDGPYDDFDPCLLPSGRIVFTSTRRRGIGRCLLPSKALTYTLHSMEPDGSDIVTLSYHETNEWQPSVNHDGMLVYTRWDYVDRWWASAHHMWLSFPDGRDPRNFHGNYPLPHSAFTKGLQPEQYGQNKLGNGRHARPDVEISFRAVPDSKKYTATAVGHHQGFSGSLVMVDPRIPDDGKMAQAKRITPEYFFPEVEPNAPHAYGTAWPLSEDFYLCNFNTGLYLLDRFGNRVVIHDPGDRRFRVRDAFPLRARKAPPQMPVKTWQGKRGTRSDHYRATIRVMNCYIGDMPLPKNIKVKSMRIIQLLPQLLTRINGRNIKLISFADESLGRIPLGIVPVEDDGSVYCEAPVGKAIYFQLLDANGMAVQSMRSATYVHAGEQMNCIGCHESKWAAVAPTPRPKAFERAPSKLIQEVSSGAIPFSYYKLVKEPVFDKKCVPCHTKMRPKHPKAPDMSYKSLATNKYAFGLPGEIGMRMLGTGGSRTTPGRFGAHASGLMKILKTAKQHKDLKLTKDQWQRITMWLDLNSNEICWISDDKEPIAAQKRGESIWPPVDMDRKNPTGVEKGYPLQGRQR